MKRLIFLFQENISQKTFLICLVFVFGVVIAPTAFAVTIIPGQGVSLAQIDFTWADATFFDSQTGQVQVEIATLQAATGIPSGYINVLTSTGWVVQNLPIISGFPYPTISTDFDLGMTGNIDSLLVLIDYSLDPVTSFGGSPTTEFPVDTVEFNAGGFFSVVTGGPPAPPPVGVVNFQIGGLIEVSFQPGHTVVQTANEQCAPEAVASSLDWLRKTYGTDIPQPHIPGLGLDGSLTGELEDFMGRTYRNREDGDPVSGGPILTGKLAYLSEYGIRNLDIKHQSGGNDISVPAGNFQAAGLTSVEVPGKPSADWIFQEIKNGEDVELGYLNPIPPGGGHFVEVVAAGYILGAPFIIHKSDQQQTHRDPNDELGTDGAQAGWLEDTDGDGRPNLVGEPNTPNVELIVSESPKAVEEVEVSATPQSAPVGTPATITVKNNGTEPVHITNVDVHRPSCQHDNIDVDVVLEPGEEVSWGYPDAFQPQNPNANVDEVGEYTVTVTHNDKDVIQTTFERYPPGAIPTLTEWGLIIFGVVLLGFITWVFLKRRKAIAVRV